MVYPTVLSIVCVCVVVFLITFILPTFVGMFQGSDVALPLQRGFCFLLVMV